MTVGTGQTGYIETYHEDEIVVDLRYREHVKQVLRGFRVDVAERSESDGRLGLALLRLPKLAEQPQRDRSGADEPWREHWRRAYDEVTREPHRAYTSNLDVLLRAIRSYVGDRNGGWCFDVAKNRVVADVEGLPYISGGGTPGRPPRPVPGPALRTGRTLRDRRGPGRGVRVALLDTPIFPGERLAGRYTVGTDTDIYRPGAQPMDAAAGHSVYISGLVLGRAPGARLQVQRVLSPQHARASAWELATAMAGLAGSGIDILIMACGAHTADGQQPLLLARAVQLLTPDIVIVAAAGNHGDVETTSSTSPVTPDSPTWPAALPEVTAVGADDASGERASFSPRGPWVALSAPGVDLTSDYLTGKVKVREPVPGKPGEFTEEVQRFDGYAEWSGTSFAVAEAAGEIAARTRPGRTSAQEALHQLLAGRAAQSGIRTRPRPGTDPGER